MIMPVQESNEYSLLKTSIIRLAEDLSPSDLLSLIEEFESVINSKRRSSLIRNCSDLITVLEKRGHIDSSSYTPLKKIIQRLPSTQERDNMLTRLSEERSRSAPFTASNHYAPRQQENRYASVNASFRYSQRINYEVNNQPGILPDAVIELVSEEIGSKWRDMARKLKLKEGDISRIQSEHGKDLYQCAHQCLILYQSKCDRYELEKNLLSALEKARRNDLRNQVQKMLIRRDIQRLD